MRSSFEDDEPKTSELSLLRLDKFTSSTPRLPRFDSVTSVDKSRLRMLFISLATSKTSSRSHYGLSLDGFKKAINYLQADIETRELVDIFSQYDVGSTGFINFSDFKAALTKHRNWKLFCLTVPPSFTINRGYDYTKSTNENYGIEEEVFWGKYASIRKDKDYSYHTNYSKERQQWQDMVVSSLFTHPTTEENPWIVYTCGAMGAGKGYVMRWLLANGYLPLKHLVHIDPDYFKTLMPEWKGYLDRNPESAGTLCHRESSYIQELAQEVALSKRVHTWVDGSLRDYQWFTNVFEAIKDRFPYYSIAVFYIHAPAYLVRERIRIRTRETGRKIPEKLIADCLNANDDSLGFLADKVDFVARILNGDSKIPILETFESVDRSGNWWRMQVQFTNKFSPRESFPNGLGPLMLKRTSITEFNLVLLDKRLVEQICSSNVVEAKIGAIDMRLEKVLKLIGNTKLYLSPLRAQNMSTSKEWLADIPNETHMFAWCNPAEMEEKTKNNLDSADPNAMFFLSGGFVYFDVNFNVIGVNAVSGLGHQMSKNEHMVLFGDSQKLRISAAVALEKKGRWGSVTFPCLLRKGAKHLAWIVPGEKLGGVRFPRFGGFALLFESLESLSKMHTNVESDKAFCGYFYPMQG